MPRANTTYVPTPLLTDTEVVSQVVAGIRQVACGPNAAEQLKSYICSKAMIEPVHQHIANTFHAAGVPAEAILLEPALQTPFGTHHGDVVIVPPGCDIDAETTIANEAKSQLCSVSKNRRNHAYAMLGHAAEQHGMFHRRVVGWFDLVFTAEPDPVALKAGRLVWKASQAPAARLLMRREYGHRRPGAKRGEWNEAAEAYGLLTVAPGPRGGAQVLNTAGHMQRAGALTADQFAELAPTQRDRARFDVANTVDRLLDVHRRRFGERFH